MFWKLPRAEWEAGRTGGNQRAMQRAAQRRIPPGLLAYDGDEPVGWCAVEPRANYARLNTGRSKVLAPVDDQPVWSVTCFFVARTHRRRGVTVELLKAAVRHARKHGGRIVEGYPIDSPKPQADTFAYTGLKAAFDQAGFHEVARRSPTRPVMRCEMT